MLSLMRKHAQSWIIKAALFVIAIVFVFWGVGSFRSERATRLAKVNGKTISVNQFQEAFRQAADRYRDLYGQALDDKILYSKEFKMQILEGLIEKELLREKAVALGLSPTPEELSRSIQKMPFFQENGRFSPLKYRRVLQMNRMTPEAFEAEQAVLLEQERLASFLKGFVKVDPEEVRRYYAFLNDELNVQYVLFSKDAYKQRISLTPEQVKAYYQKHSDRYRTPLQVRVLYWQVGPKEFASQVTVTEQEIRSHYQQNPSRYQDPKTGQPAPLEKVRETIRAALIEDKAMEMARQKAEEVYDQILTQGNLRAFARGSGLPVKETDWLTSGERRSGLEGAPEFVQKAFSLKKGEMTSVLDLGGEWGFVVMQVSERKEPQAMTLDQAQDRVKEDLLEESAAARARSEAETFLGEIKGKKDFVGAARARGLKIEESGFFTRIKNQPAWAQTPEGQEILFALGPSSPFPERPVTVGKDQVVVAFKERRPASAEGFEKDREKFAEALKQQKEALLLDRWKKGLRRKAKVTVYPDLL